MNCHEIKELLPLYLDSDLEPERAHAFAMHLETCASCRERVEAETRFERALASALGRGERGDADLWSRATARLGTARPAWRWLGSAALAAAVLLVAVFAGWWWFGHHELDLAAAAAPLHRSCTMEGPALSIDELRAHLEGRGVDWVPDSWLVGGPIRWCHADVRKLRGAPVVHLAGKTGGEPCSVFFMRVADLPAFPDVVAAAIPGAGAIHCSIGPDQFVLFREGDVAVFALGPVPHAGLELLARGSCPR